MGNALHCCLLHVLQVYMDREPDPKKNLRSLLVPALLHMAASPIIRAPAPAPVEAPGHAASAGLGTNASAASGSSGGMAGMLAAALAAALGPAAGGGAPGSGPMMMMMEQRTAVPALHAAAGRTASERGIAAASARYGAAMASMSTEQAHREPRVGGVPGSPGPPSPHAHAASPTPLGAVAASAAPGGGMGTRTPTPSRTFGGLTGASDGAGLQLASSAAAMSAAAAARAAGGGCLMERLLQVAAALMGGSWAGWLKGKAAGAKRLRDVPAFEPAQVAQIASDLQAAFSASSAATGAGGTAGSRAAASWAEDGVAAVQQRITATLPAAAVQPLLGLGVVPAAAPPDAPADGSTASATAGPLITLAGGAGGLASSAAGGWGTGCVATAVVAVDPGTVLPVASLRAALQGKGRVAAASGSAGADLPQATDALLAGAVRYSRTPVVQYVGRH